MSQPVTASYVSFTRFPEGTRFRIKGTRPEWEEAKRTPTKVRLRYWRSAFGAPWIMRPVTRYVDPDTEMEVVPA